MTPEDVEAELVKVLKERDELEAQYAAMREALATVRAREKCGEDYGRCLACDQRLDSALASDAGKALLKRLEQHRLERDVQRERAEKAERALSEPYPLFEKFREARAQAIEEAAKVAEAGGCDSGSVWQTTDTTFIAHNIASAIRALKEGT
jgi:hypothetical protein